MIKYHVGVTFTPLQLHTLCGRNVRVSSDRTLAVRLREEYCNAYVFSARSISPGQKVVVQILGVECSYIGGLGVGLTACDPATLTSSNLPDDADLFLDRPEYWVVNKDVCRNPEVGDELAFAVTNSGEVLYSRNNGKLSTLMHVDRTLPLWAFFDLYGNVQKIKIIGTTALTPGPSSLMIRSHSASGYSNLSVALPQPSFHHLDRAPDVDSLPPPLQPLVLRSFSVPSTQATSLKSVANPSTAPVKSNATSLPTSPVNVNKKPLEVITPEEAKDECTVCCEKPVNCVLYTCGHMCMCFECASAVKMEKGGLCPICRQCIKDIIKIYRS